MGFKDDVTRFISKYGMDGRSEVIGAETVRVYIRDNEGYVLLAVGMAVPTNDTGGYAKGCMFIKYNAGDTVAGNYLNKGLKDACQFTLITQA